MVGLEIHDSSMRDGNHAVKHQLSLGEVQIHCLLAEKAGIDSVEIGHGNGLGASSFQVGFAAHSDRDLISTARACLSNTKLAVHVMPGFATYERDIKPAIDLGVEIFRIGVHVTEADLAFPFINKLANHSDLRVIPCLMMSHMANADKILQQVELLNELPIYGVSLYDSAGSYRINTTEKLISLVVNEFPNLVIGFHGHNNLGLGIANSLAAIDSGAKLIDASICGFGAGAGNTQYEVLVSLLKDEGKLPNLDISTVYALAEYAAISYASNKPFPKPVSIVSSISGVFSGFAPHVERAASLNNVDPLDLFRELGKRGVVGGQEDLIYATASTMQSNQGVAAKKIEAFEKQQPEDVYPSRKIEIDAIKCRPIEKLIDAELFFERQRFSDWKNKLQEPAEINTSTLGLSAIYPEISSSLEKRDVLYFDGPRSFGYGGYDYEPSYWSTVACQLASEFQLTSRSVILDIGCAKGFLIKALTNYLPGITVLGVDISQYAIERCVTEAKGKILKCNAAQIPLPANFIDLCVGLDFIQEVRRDDIFTVIKEIQRVSKECFLSISAASAGKEQEYASWALNAATIASSEEWERIIEGAKYTGAYQIFEIDVKPLGSKH